MNTLIVFLISMVFLLVVLIRFKWSASVGLVSATIMMGLLSGMKIADLTGAISGGFGSTMTSTGLVIIFGCIFGEMLGSSGALEEIAKFLLRKVGSKHDYLAINLLGYVVSIPVYFGSAYVMLSPLLNSLQKLTNKKMTGYVNALFVGLLLTHCIVAPTPGPVAVAAEVGANLGWFIFYGLIVSIIASLLCGWQFSNGINAKGRKEAQEFLDANSDLIKADETKPSAGIGFALILFPIILIVLGAVVPMFVAEGGLFELAHTGTIFLDEIGDASLSVQARLLRVLEEKEVMRVGDTKVTPIDVRVIAATNKDLRELIRQGQFRSDLYFRINVFQLMLPPLRERTESIFPLIGSFSRGKIARESFTENAIHIIETYDWPGNLRELRNMVDYISIMRSRKKKIDEDQLPIDITAAASQGYQPYCPSMEQVISRFGRPLVQTLLELLAQNKDGEIRYSRSDILQYLQARKLRCSTTMLRAILSELEGQGMVLAGKTRQGTRLSASGQRYLDALHAEE